MQASAPYTQSILCTGYVPCVTDALSTQGCASETDCDCRIQNTLIHTDTATHRHIHIITHTHTPHTPHTPHRDPSGSGHTCPANAAIEVIVRAKVAVFRLCLSQLTASAHRLYSIYRVYIGYIFMHKETTPSAS